MNAAESEPIDENLAGILRVWHLLDDQQRNAMARSVVGFRLKHFTLAEYEAEFGNDGLSSITAMDWLRARVPDLAMDTMRDIRHL